MVPTARRPLPAPAGLKTLRRRPPLGFTTPVPAISPLPPYNHPATNPLPPPPPLARPEPEATRGGELGVAAGRHPLRGYAYHSGGLGPGPEPCPGLGLGLGLDPNPARSPRADPPRLLPAPLPLPRASPPAHRPSARLRAALGGCGPAPTPPATATPVVPTSASGTAPPPPCGQSGTTRGPLPPPLAVPGGRG